MTPQPLDLHDRLAALEATVRTTALGHRAAARRARLATATALVAVVVAAVWTTGPQVFAQHGPPADGLPARVAALEAQVAALKTADSGKQTRLTAVEVKAAALSDDGTNFAITGRNVHIRDGSGITNGGTGLGNLTIGYNGSREQSTETDVRTGTHNLILGDFNNYSSFGGLVAGAWNTISGPYASVSGGQFNTASGELASVSGGTENTASARGASVSGGTDNTASTAGASISGGLSNVASGNFASVSGGFFNTASGGAASVSGGFGRSAIDEFNWSAGSLHEFR
jgi:hypothetical protein